MILEEEKIRGLTRGCGIDLIGFFKPDPLIECLDFLKGRVASGFSTGFEMGLPEQRIDYKKEFPKAVSGIVIGINYYQKIKKPDDEKERAALAAVAWGEDYHRVLKRKMTNLMAAIHPKLDYRMFVDTSPLVDRGSAYRAGLGFFGKNNCLINKRYGSYFFIGQILLDTEINFSKAERIENACGSCRLCLEACPNQALGEGYTLDPQRCISFLTQKKEITASEENRIHTYVYGCDLCQTVCPYNQELKKTQEKNFFIDEEEAYPTLESLMTLSNTGFKQRFKRTAAGWRGKKILLRNAALLKKIKKNEILR